MAGLESATLMACAALMAIDGDTVRCCESAIEPCKGQNVRPMGDGEPFVSGFDTPEISGRSECPEEALLGARAMVRMAELLQTPGLVVVDSGQATGKGEQERSLVWLKLPDGRTVGGILLAEGLARPWPVVETDRWCLNF